MDKMMDTHTHQHELWMYFFEMKLFVQVIENILGKIFTSIKFCFKLNSGIFPGFFQETFSDFFVLLQIDQWTFKFDQTIYLYQRRKTL